MSGTERDRAPTSFTQVAVVGMACRYPGSPDIPSFWKTILAARPETAVEASPRHASGKEPTASPTACRSLPAW